MRKQRSSAIGMRYYGLLAFLVIIYLVTVLFFASNSALLSKYHVTDIQLRLLSLTIIIPAMAIWFTAFYSFVAVGKYVERIKNTRDGAGFMWLYRGMLTYCISLPIASLMSRILNYMAERHVIPHPAATITSLYFTAVFTLIGFALIAMGAWRLMKSVAGATLSYMQIIGVAVALILISIPYTIVTLSNPSRTTPKPPAIVATFYMPDWQIITTVIVPYIIIWGLGFYATLMLHVYHKRVRGSLYKHALKRLNTGFFVVIIATIITQFISATATVILGWRLNAILSLLYIFLAITAFGFVLIALGAQRLKKLEEVT